MRPRRNAEMFVRLRHVYFQDSDDSQKVTISTCHAAKGLEWPIVIIPSGASLLNSNTLILKTGQLIRPPSLSIVRKTLMKRGPLNFQFPGNICLKQIIFERRLLYVACTRAQCLLYILYSEQRKVAGKARAKCLSEFVDVPREKNAVRLIFFQKWTLNLQISSATFRLKRAPFFT